MLAWGRWNRWEEGHGLFGGFCCKRLKKRIIEEPVRRPVTFIKY